MTLTHTPLTRRRLLRTAGAASALLAAPSVITAQSPITLRMSSWLQFEGDVVKNLFRLWADDVARVTDGRVAIDFLEAPLGPPPAHLGLVQSGEADVAYSLHGYTDDVFPRARIGQFTSLGDAYSASHAFSKIYRELLNGDEEHTGMKMLGVFQHGPGVLMLKDKVIRGPEDFAGLRIRTSGGAVARLLELMGGENVPMSPVAVRGAMDAGEIDGVMFPYEAAGAFNTYEPTTFISEFPGGYYNATWFLAMSEAAAANIDPVDLARIEEQSSATVATLAAKAFDYVDYLSKEEFKARGVPIEVPTGELKDTISAFAAQGEAAWSEEVAALGYDGAKALAFTRRLTGQG